MAKIIYAIENSFDDRNTSGLADIAAGIAFLALVLAGFSWLMI